MATAYQSVEDLRGEIGSTAQSANNVALSATPTIRCAVYIGTMIAKAILAIAYAILWHAERK